MHSISQPSAVVIGSGIVGLTSACQLSRAGFRVELVERGALAQEASWAGGGLLTPLPPWQADPALWQMAAQSLAGYAGFCAELYQATGIDPEYQRCGMDVLDAEQFPAASQWCAGQRLESALVQRAYGTALHLPWVAQLRNPRLCKALLAWLRQQGVALHAQCGELQLQAQGPLAAVTWAGQQRRPDVLVIAAGAWSAQLAAPLGWSLPIKPCKGQMLAYQLASPRLRSAVLHKGRYLIPRQDGLLLVGSTLEDSGFDKQTTAEAQQALHGFACELLPELAGQLPAFHWAGLRPESPGGLPIVQRHPQLNNAYVNTGHFRYGLTLALATAEQLMALVRE